jgi:hypothetical protein
MPAAGGPRSVDRQHRTTGREIGRSVFDGCVGGWRRRLNGDESQSVPSSETRAIVISEDPQAMRRRLGSNTLIVATALPAVIMAGIATATNRVELAARLRQRAVGVSVVFLV